MQLNWLSLTMSCLPSSPALPPHMEVGARSTTSARAGLREGDRETVRLVP